MMNAKFVAAGFVAVLLLILTAVVAFTLGKSMTSQKLAVNTPVPTVLPQAPQVGYIEGSLSYPSEVIPEEMQICAETLQRQKVTCTTEHIQIDIENGYGLGYNLEVPAGNYYVYAFLPSNTNQKAYYNEFVTCGLKASCPSHVPIEVIVAAGETVKDINPHDWYDTEPQL